jgi:hypothetical protein
MTTEQPALGLGDLSAVTLEPRYAEMWRAARASAGGARFWKERMFAESRDLCALAGLAPRMELQRLDLATQLTAIVRLRMPVPCRFGDGDLVIAQEATLGIRYPREVLRASLPGTAFVQVLQPFGVFVPTVAAGPVQVACLGDKLPVGIRVIELLLMTFRSLALQDYTIDERDPAGVMCADAARYYQRHTNWLPLTDEPFLGRVDAASAEVSHD